MTNQYIPPASPETSSDDRLWGLLSFLLTPLVPIIAILMEDKKNRPFIKHNAISALLLGVAEVVLGGILGLIPIIQCFVPLLWIINIIYALKANKGEYVDVPVLTAFARNQGWL